MSWTTIESDPGVFTNLVEEFGVRDVEVTELISLDQESLASVKELYGIVFLFKYDTSLKPDAASGNFSHSSGLYFANQVINNACATQALVHVLLNTPDIDIGPALADFKSFTAGFPSDMRGESLGMSDAIRTAHNSFARAEPFMSEERAASGDDEAFHFVAYLPHAGKVYELDGLQPAPIEVGQVAEGDEWWSTAASEIQRRISQYGADELRFAVMGICKSERSSIQADLALNQNCIDAVNAASDTATGAGSSAELGDFQVSPDAAGRTQQLEQLQEEQARLQSQLQADDAKRAAWAKENARRQHNYVPLAVALFQAMAGKNMLLPKFEQAKEKRDEEMKRAAERRASRKAQAATDASP